MGICGTDLHIIADEFVSNPPVVMGHEVTGHVRELGAGVDPAWLGKRVAPETYFTTCDLCPRCLEGRRNLCPTRRSIGSHVNGGFAQYVAIPARNLHEVHESVGELAGSLYEPLACVANCLCDPAVVSPGDSVLVVGPGAMGILTCQVLAAQGADVVLSGTARDAARLELARSMGIRTIDAADAEASAPGPGYDCAVDCSGAAAGIRIGAPGHPQGRSVCAGRRDRQAHRVRDGPGVPQGARGHVRVRQHARRRGTARRRWSRWARCDWTRSSPRPMRWTTGPRRSIGPPAPTA